MGRARVLGMVLIAVGAVPMAFGLGAWLLGVYLYLSNFSFCGGTRFCYGPPSPAFLFVGLFGSVLVITGTALIVREPRMGPAITR